MPEFFALSRADRREALAVAAENSGRPFVLLEKDVWVVATLGRLFAGPHADNLVFKGGTSLSKAYHAIRRFSEDVDVTYDIRAIAGDLVGDRNPPLPETTSAAKRWSETIRKRLPLWLSGEIVPALLTSFGAHDMTATFRIENDQVFISYASLGEGTGYVSPTVRLEFGARSTGEPAEARTIQCDAAEHIPEITFPTATPRVMSAERTFWEKATAIHVFCLQKRFRGGARFARHWHDVARLDEAGITDRAVADRVLARAVAEHKTMFFRENDIAGRPIDYGAAVSGHLWLVPDTDALATLQTDYQRMTEERFLLDAPGETFADLMERCRAIQDKANAGHLRVR